MNLIVMDKGMQAISGRQGSILVQKWKCAEEKNVGDYRGVQWVREGLLPYPKHGSCVHYEPAVLKKSKVLEKQDSVKGNIGKKDCIQPARSYIVSDGAKTESSWYCEACGMTVKDRQRKKIEQIVEYLNQDGDDSQKLCNMFHGIEIGEIMQLSHGKTLLKGSAVCVRDYVPPKNIYQ